LTGSQVEVLEQLKDELTRSAPHLLATRDDSTLIRFLRARHFDVAKTCQMLAECDAWRTSFGVDVLFTQFDPSAVPLEMSALLPQYFHKTSKASVALLFYQPWIRR
jgi:CRAL/TRIO, N-terminal domain